MYSTLRKDRSNLFIWEKGDFLASYVCVCQLILDCVTVFKWIFILDRIEYRILFALAKLTESNNEYYSCCEIYSNNIRIVQDIRIFEYFRIIFNAKMKDLLKYQKTLCFVKMPSVLTIIRPKLNYHSFCFLLNKYLFK